MLKTLTTAFLVLFAVAASSDSTGAGFVDYRLASSSRSSRSVDSVRALPCTSLNPRMCDTDCQSVWTCVPGPLGSTGTLIETCDPPKTCNNGLCSTTASPECAMALQPFVCSTEGIFPDPATCRKYHYCIRETNGFTDFERTCSYNRGYNPGTGYCDIRLTNDRCGHYYPVPICTIPGQNGVIRGNPSIYYECTLYGNTGPLLYPYLYVCRDGKVYTRNSGCI